MVDMNTLIRVFKIGKYKNDEITTNRKLKEKTYSIDQLMK